MRESDFSQHDTPPSRCVVQVPARRARRVGALTIRAMCRVRSTKPVCQCAEMPLRVKAVARGGLPLQAIENIHVTQTSRAHHALSYFRRFPGVALEELDSQVPAPAAARPSASVPSLGLIGPKRGSSFTDLDSFCRGDWRAPLGSFCQILTFALDPGERDSRTAEQKAASPRCC